jgi:outer membrane protein TolC
MAVIKLSSFSATRLFGLRDSVTVWVAAGLTTAGLVTAGPRRAVAQSSDSLPSAPSAVVRPLVLSGVAIPREQTGIIRLTLDQAIIAALKNNTELTLRHQQENYVHGQTLAVGSVLTPNLSLQAYTQAQEINLAARGFKSGSVHIPGVSGAIPTIVKVNTSDVQLNLSQTIFNVPAFFLFSAARKAVEAANWSTRAARGSIVLKTGALYLKTLADQAQIVNAEALLAQDQLVFEHARASRDAGVGVNIDVLRAQVQLQNEQQQLIRTQNATAEDKIQINREMNEPAGQQLDLVDTVPFAELAELPLDQALRTAYVYRKDLRGLEAQLEVAEKTQKAVRYERLPTLGFGGFYGVLGETTGLYHGVFAAEGFVSVPVFQEATLRGQKEVAAAQVSALRNQIASSRKSIEAEIRSSMLDVESSRELVMVARSNVDLSLQELSDATDRFTAGVSDDLEVVRAQASLEGAQAQLVQSEFQYNYAKLTLARNTGLVETQYQHYLGR